MSKDNRRRPSGLRIRLILLLLCRMAQWLGEIQGCKKQPGKNLRPADLKNVRFRLLFPSALNPLPEIPFSRLRCVLQKSSRPDHPSRFRGTPRRDIEWARSQADELVP